MEKFSDDMIETLRKTYSTIDKIDPDSPIYKGICKVLDKSSDEALRQLYEAHIKFVSLLAGNRLLRRRK